MKPAPIIAIVVVILLLLGGAYYLILKHPAPAGTLTGTGTTTIDGTDLAAPQKLVMTSGVTINFYADTYGLAVTDDQMPKSVIPPCDSPFDYCLYRVATDYQNTNLESAGITIKVRKDLTTKQTCLTTKPEGYTNLVASTTETSTYASSAFGPIGDAGAGHYSSGNQYRLWSGTTCTEFTTRIGETQFANYPAGTKTEFTKADEKNLMAEMNSILYDIHLAGAQVKFPGI